MNMHSVNYPYDFSRTFDNIGAALREVATIVFRLEDAALQMSVCTTDTSQKTRSLQDFDLVLQSLADLATLMQALSENGPARTAAEQEKMIAQMRLAWLRDLIGGAAPQTGPDVRTSIF